MGGRLPTMHCDALDSPSFQVDTHPGCARLVAAIQNPAIGVASQGSAALTSLQVRLHHVVRAIRF